MRGDQGIGIIAGGGRRVLHEIVAKATPGHEKGRKAAARRGLGQRIAERAHFRIDREIGPVDGQAPARRERIETAPPEPLVEIGRAGGVVEIDEDRVELRRGAGEIALGGVDNDVLAQIEPAARDRGHGLVGLDQGRRAVRQIGAQEAPHRRPADAQQQRGAPLPGERKRQRHQPLVVEDEARRIEEIHARLLGHLGAGAERAERAVVPDAAVEIDNEDRGAESLGATQQADARCPAEIVEDQPAPPLLAELGDHHRTRRPHTVPDDGNAGLDRGAAPFEKSRGRRGGDGNGGVGIIGRDRVLIRCSKSGRDFKEMTAEGAMRAQLLTRIGEPLAAAELPVPRPGPHQVLIRIGACAVCRTDLHVVDGELPDPKLPLVPGHEIIGTVVETGSEVERFAPGDRVGVPWLGWTCGVCEYCRCGRENLCERARFTGYQIDGGYAELTVADERYCFAIDPRYDDVAAAPLMCAGLIGYRSLRLAGEAERIGIYGFGAAAHIIAQVARHQGRRLFAFTRPGDVAAQHFARTLGAEWAGASTEPPPEPLDAALIFAPVGALVPAALAATRKGGVVVCGGIHMSDIPAFPYRLLWQERVVRSVANLTRRDAEEFLALAPLAGVRTETHTYPLAAANQALADLRRGAFQGAAVLVP
jgi:propanol-preferring alcohol dehydrogenase